MAAMLSPRARNLKQTNKMTIEYQRYPEKMDCVWIAGDKNGFAGVFITGGIGPIPLECLQVSNFDIIDTEEDLLKLAPISSAEVFSDAPVVDSYVALAERGFYVFDWLDVEKLAVDRMNRYELVARAANPRKIADLLTGLNKDIHHSQLNVIDFTRATYVGEGAITDAVVTNPA